jgi:GxxExxY protein
MIYEKELCESIIGCAIEVHKRLGSGYLEKVYERALMFELRNAGLCCESQTPLKVFYREEVVGEYFVDIIVENKVLLELKSYSGIVSGHEAQLINYLTSTRKQIGYI